MARSPFFKKKNSNNNNGQGSIQKIDRAPSSVEFAAQNSAELGSSGAGSDEPARTLERPSVSMNNLSQNELSPFKDDVVAEAAVYASADDAVLGLQKLGKNDSRGISRNFVEADIRARRKESLLRFFNIRRRRQSSLNGGGNDGNESNDGDDGDNNGGGGDKNKKKGGGHGDGEGNGDGGDKAEGGGHGDGEGNGDGGDKAEGGGGKEKGVNMDCTGQLGFGYRCTYHAGYENGYPVEQLNALKMFCSENMINDCSIMPPVRDVSSMIWA